MKKLVKAFWTERTCVRHDVLRDSSSLVCWNVRNMMGAGGRSRGDMTRKMGKNRLSEGLIDCPMQLGHKRLQGFLTGETPADLLFLKKCK